MKTSHLIPPPGWVFSERISFEDAPEGGTPTVLPRPCPESKSRLTPP